MHRQLDEKAQVVERAAVAEHADVSTDPATGEEIWSGEIGDAAAEVAAARAALAGLGRPFARLPDRGACAASPMSCARTRAEFAELISRETGKPFWEARTEVGAVVNKVEISIDAYAERTPQRKLEAALGNRIAVRHKPHGVLAVLGPYNFPAHLPNGHIVPALIAGNAVVFKPSEKTPATGEFLVDCFHEAKIPEGVVRLLIGGPDAGQGARRRAGDRRPAVHRLGARRHVAPPPVRRHCRTRSSRSSSAATTRSSCGTPRTSRRRRSIVVQSAYLTAGQRCTAARRLIVEDGQEGELLDAITEARSTG